MRLSEILEGRNATAMLEDLLDPATTRPPHDKGSDAIKVQAYVVRSHWRKRWFPISNGRRRRR